MTIRRLFTYIWRVNAVLILFVGGLAAVALIYSLYHLAKDVTAQTSVYGKLQTNDSGVSHTSNWKLFGFTRVGETPYFYSSLTDTQSYSYGMRSKESYGVANYLFYDSQTGISHWLFPTRDWLCLNMQEVPHSDFQKLPVKRIFYTIGAAKTSALKLDHDFAKM
jgi:hypothetical protein